MQEQSESFRTVPWSSRSASGGPVRTPRKHPVPGGLFLCVSECCFGPGEAPGRAGELRRSPAGLTRPWERAPTPWNGRGAPTGAPGPPSGSQRIYTRRPPPGSPEALGPCQGGGRWPSTAHRRKALDLGYHKAPTSPTLTLILWSKVDFEVDAGSYTTQSADRGYITLFVHRHTEV